MKLATMLSTGLAFVAAIVCVTVPVACVQKELAKQDEFDAACRNVGGSPVSNGQSRICLTRGN